jgi:hypothetical protein
MSEITQKRRISKNGKGYFYLNISKIMMQWIASNTVTVIFKQNNSGQPYLILEPLEGI